jgi:hypothetical protein
MEADVMRCVRSLVLTVAALAATGFVGSGATALGGETDTDQARAVAMIERVGGFVSPGALLIPQGLVVVIEGSKASDRDLVYLKSLKSLCVLGLDDTRITDAGLAHLKGLKNLKSLSLERTKVTDAGLAHLQGLPKLRELDLKGTRVTDAGIVHLADMKHLRELSVAETGITAEGIKRLRRSLRWCRIR